MQQGIYLKLHARHAPLRLYHAMLVMNAFWLLDILTLLGTAAWDSAACQLYLPCVGWRRCMNCNAKCVCMFVQGACSRVSVTSTTEFAGIYLL